jgi:hypothetical protein
VELIREHCRENAALYRELVVRLSSGGIEKAARAKREPLRAPRT